MNDLPIHTSIAQSGRGNVVMWTAALLAIAYALQINDGSYESQAMAWVGIATLLAWAGFFLPFGTTSAAYAMCAMGIVLQILIMVRRPLWVGQEGVLRWLMLLLTILATGALAARGWYRAIFVGALAGVYFAVGVNMIYVSEPPHIDVYEVTTGACTAMEQGRNPYAIDFRDIYIVRPDWETAYYPPGYVYGGRVHFGYQYMPLSLLVAIAGHLIGGDYRYGNLMAMAAACVLLGCSRSRYLAAAGAVLLLTMPRGFFVIQYGWAEPVVVLCMALVVFCATRWPTGLPYAAGLLLASNQHILLAAPALWLIMPKEGRGRFILKVVGTALIVTLPIVLWSPRAFWHSAIVAQLAHPFRNDSLNFAAGWTHLGHAPLPGAISFFLGGIAAAVVAWRGPRTLAGFAGGVAVIYLTFFALSKQTFCNYYFLAVGALCCAVAAKPETGESS